MLHFKLVDTVSAQVLYGIHVTYNLSWISKHEWLTLCSAPLPHYVLKEAKISNVQDCSLHKNEIGGSDFHDSEDSSRCFRCTSRNVFFIPAFLTQSKLATETYSEQILPYDDKLEDKILFPLRVHLIITSEHIRSHKLYICYRATRHVFRPCIYCTVVHVCYNYP